MHIWYFIITQGYLIFIFASDYGILLLQSEHSWNIFELFPDENWRDAVFYDFWLRISECNYLKFRFHKIGCISDFNIKSKSILSIATRKTSTPQRQGYGVIQVIDLGYDSKFEIFMKSSDFGCFSDSNIKSKSRSLQFRAVDVGF